MSQISHNVQETQALAKEWIKAHSDLKIWLLKGDLGAGKTSFVKGIAEAFEEDAALVKSPTFSIIEEHKGWIHADLYRLDQDDAFIAEELEEYLKAGYTLFIEWPERFSLWQNHPRVEIEFQHLGGEKRELTLNLLP